MKCFICWANEVDTPAVMVVAGTSVCEQHADTLDAGRDAMDIVNRDAAR